MGGIEIGATAIEQVERDESQREAARESEGQGRRHDGMAKAAAVDVQSAEPSGGERNAKEKA